MNGDDRDDEFFRILPFSEMYGYSPDINAYHKALESPWSTQPRPSFRYLSGMYTCGKNKRN